MKKLLKKAIRNKELAAAIIGQVIVDEAYIGTDQIIIGYHSKQNAEAIWKLADIWSWANPLQNSIYVDNRKPNEKKRNWRFSLKRKCIKEIHELIGSLPDKNREEKMKLASRINYRQHRPNETPLKLKILTELQKGPKTTEDLVKKFGMSSSIINRNLRTLRREDNVTFKKINGYGRLEYTFNRP